MSVQDASFLSGPLLQMELRPSRLLLGSVILVHVAAASAVMVVDLGITLRLAIVVALLCYCQACCRAQKDVSGLQMSSGEIALQWRGQLIPVSLVGAPYCTEWLQVLRFKPVDDMYSRSGSGALPAALGRRLNVVVLPDSSCRHSRRRLRVLLRWYRFSNGVPV